ncbi:MAG TPA: hypothetical protein VKB80_03455 [Kofleriaceae bacterium]|nr:hypothetical protein [Kofleriaceae bacterium]
MAGAGFLGLACPTCAMGQEGGGASGLLFIGALILLPLCAAAVAGLVIGRLLRRWHD